MSGEAALNQVRAASMRALMPLTFQVAIFMTTLLSLPGLTGQSSNHGQDQVGELGEYWIPAFGGMTRIC